MSVYDFIGKLPRPKKGFVLPSHHYTGPYNPLHKQLDKKDVPIPGQEPFNGVDKISLNHDICYRDAQLTKKQCDEEMLKKLNKLDPKNLRESIDKNLVQTIIGLKQNLDNLSPLSSRGGGIMQKITTSKKNKIPLEFGSSKDPIIRDKLTKLHMKKAGFSLNKEINNQRALQNFQNNYELYKNTEHFSPHSFWNSKHPQESNKNAYVSSMIDLDFNNVNIKPNITSTLQQQQQQQQQQQEQDLDNNTSMTTLALSTNNPYILFDSNQTSQQSKNPTNHQQSYEENDYENQFLNILIDLKQLYLNDSFSSNVNESRNKMLNILIDFFYKHNANNDYWLDDKQCLCFRNLRTGVKFQLYVDYFVKQYDPSRSKSRPPMYFNELFKGMILNSQTKFSPTVQHSSKNTKKLKKMSRNRKRKSKNRNVQAKNRVQTLK